MGNHKANRLAGPATRIGLGAILAVLATAAVLHGCGSDSTDAAAAAPATPAPAVAPATSFVVAGWQSDWPAVPPRGSGSPTGAGARSTRARCAGGRTR